ncbi:MAG: DUF512 domain-containing protein [Coriobacteriia bacterium]|nr:DUF512 domain-containing protein [Coriobacteriia bacterium]
MIEAVEKGSPAERGGLQAGMVVKSVNGHALRDVLDWFWLADGQSVELLVSSSQSSRPLQLAMRRQPFEPWGLGFTELLFDGLMTCVNKCSFCFVEMLPAGLRPSLYVRDDDYRLSFLQGTFVTLTNVSQADIDRIIEYRLSPLRVSLHTVDPELRYRLIGKKAPDGLAAIEALLGAGIELHVQVVLMPNVNDGPYLDQTIDWINQRRGVVSAGIVPYAYTRYAPLQVAYTPGQAVLLIDRLYGLYPKIQLSDEWFVLAQREVPNHGYYGDYPQYENGIGMMRSFIDDFESLASSYKANGLGLPPQLLVTGQAFAPTLAKLIADAGWSDGLSVLAVENRFFGGSVNATGLLTAVDIIDAVKRSGNDSSTSRTVVLPNAIFNQEGLTLDGYSLAQLEAELKRLVHVVTYTSELFLD